MKKAAGRPRNLENTDIITLDECLKRVQTFLGLEEPPFQRRALQNKITMGEYARYGTYHKPMVDWNEVKRTLHWRRKVS